MGKKPMVRMSQELKSQLEKIKIHPRETYEQVIQRVITKDLKGELKGEDKTNSPDASRSRKKGAKK